MSKVVDQKVVEMQFDNRHFEKNVSKTMTTLEKLKQSLKLPDASKSLDGINRSAKNVNLSGIGNAVDAVQTKFSALQVVGVTALANITNSAVNAGKRIVKALTIDPVNTGFSEYELKMGSLRTIMASTGESLGTVTKYLDELNKYSDMTIYSFSDMTQNIGKFTNAGVKLEDAVAAIKGISNEAAVSGANANEASRAMYNFAQALSAGYVKLIDWKSIENANMATVEFKNELIKTALELKTVTKGADGMYKTLEGKAFNATKNFNEVLQDQWMTSEVLVTTLKKYADNTTDIGKKAEEAATKVRTFTQLMDTLKESAQSGWARTWEILVGDYYQAEDLFTDISEAVGGFIDKMSKMRNNTLEEVFSSPWDKLSQKISESGKEMSEYEEAIRKVAKAQKIGDKQFKGLIEKHGSLVKAVQAGAISTDILKDALEELGIGVDKSASSLDEFIGDIKTIERVLGRGSVGDDVKKLQTALDKLGHSVGECGIDGIIGPDTMSAIKEFQREAGIAVDGIAGPETLAALEKAGTKISEVDENYSDLLKDISKKGGRDLLLESISNVVTAVTKPLESIRDAWNETFGDINMSDTLYNLIEKFHELTEKLIITDEAAANLKQVFEGLFAGFQIGNMMISKTFTAGLKILTAVLDLFGTDLLEVAGHIASYITKLRDWIDEHTIFINTYDKIANVIVTFIKGIKSCVDAFKSLPQISAAIEKFKSKFLELFGGIGKDFDLSSIDKFCESMEKAFESARKWIEGLKDSENLGKDLIDGLVNGLKDGVKKVVETVVSLAKNLIDAFCEVTGINSPSKVFFALGGFIVSGLLFGLKDQFPTVWEAFKTFGLKCVEALSNLSLGEVIGAIFGIGLLLTVRKVLNIAEMLATPIVGIGKMTKSLANMFDNIGESFNKKESKWTTISKAILTIALAIGVLTAAAVVLGKMETDELVRAGVAIVVMAGVIAGLMVLSKTMAKVDGFGDSFKSVIVISGAMLLLAFTMKKLAQVDIDNVPAVLATMAIMIAGISAVLLAYGALAKGKSAQYMGKAGSMMIKLSAALLLMTLVFKVVGKISDKDIFRGIAVVGAVELLFAAMVAIVKGSGANASKVGTMLLKMSTAMLLMIGVVKLAAGLDAETVLKGMSVLILVEALFVAMVAVSKKAGPNAAKAGAMLLMMSGALAITAFVIKQASELDGDQVAKGLIIVAAIEVLFMALIAVSKKAGKDSIKAGVMLLAMSGALVILTGVMYLFSKMDPDGLGRALGVVTVLEVLFMGLIGVTKYAKNCIGTLVVLTVAISMLTVAVTALSFLDPDGLKNATAALSMVITSFALLVAATQYAKNSKQMNKTLVTMLVVVGTLAAIIAALSFIDSEGALESAAALSVLMLSFAGSLAIMGMAGRISTTVSKQILPMLGVVAGLATILGLMSALNVQAAIPTAVALSTLLTAMAGALFILSYTGPMAAGNIGSMALLGLVVAEIAVILGIMQTLHVEASIETAASLSVLLLAMAGACAIVSLIPAAAAAQGALGLAAFVGIMGGVIAALGALTLIPGFTDLMSDGGKMLGDIGFAIGNFVGNILGGFSAGAMSGLPSIGTHLSGFMANAQPFIDGVAKIDASMMDGVKTLAEAILTLTAANMLTGISSLIGLGDSSLEGFGTQLATLGTSMSTFATNLGTFSDEQVNTVTCAADAIKAMAEAASAIPKEGGWLESITGGNSLDMFGDKLPAIALKLHEFVTMLGGFGNDQLDIVTNASKAIVAMANAASEIPNDGGWLEAIVGGNNMDTFGAKLPSLASNLSGFVASLGEFGKDKLDSVKNAANAIKVLAKASTEIPNEGGWMEAIVGGNSVDTFGAKLSTLGTNLASFVASISGVNLDNVDSAANVLKAIIDLVNIDFTSATSGISTFCDKMKTLASDAVDKFAEKLSSHGSKQKAKDAIVELVEAAADKADSSSMYTKFKSAGKNLVDGFAEGISDRTYKAEAKARAMAKAAADAAEEALDINSPSKVFRAIGTSVPEGFALGIDKFGNMVANSTTRMTDRALDIARHSVDLITGIMGSDMNPVIAPVLDLTNVESGASALSGMLNVGSSIGVQANVGAISSMMASRGQNGYNGEVVMAIDRLRKDLGRVGNTYNSVNGITYDNGSEVANAVKVLVRAAKVERRV